MNLTQHIIANLPRTTSTGPRRTSSTLNHAIRLATGESNSRISHKSTPQKVVIILTRRVPLEQQGTATKKGKITITAGIGSECVFQYSGTYIPENEWKVNFEGRMRSNITERNGECTIDRSAQDAASLRENLRTCGIYCMTSRDNSINAASIQCIMTAFMEGARIMQAGAITGEWELVERLPLSYIGLVFREEIPAATTPASA